MLAHLRDVRMVELRGEPGLFEEHLYEVRVVRAIAQDPLEHDVALDSRDPRAAVDPTSATPPCTPRDCPALLEGSQTNGGYVAVDQRAELCGAGRWGIGALWTGRTMRPRRRDPRTVLAGLRPMVRRALRIACVLVVATLTTQACVFAKKRTGTGTNLGSGFGSGNDLPPPGQPSFQDEQR